MGSGEPALAPEWLRGGRGGTSPNANSDDNGVGILLRNGLPLIPSGQDSWKSSSGRNSSKGSEAYSNFGRKDRKKNSDSLRDRDRERSLLGNIASRDYHNSVTVSRTDSDRPWRNNHAGVLGRCEELRPKKPESDYRSVVLPTSENVSGGGIRRSSAFKRDFPKLVSVENKGGLEMDKVSSAVESIALPTAAGDRWTSVLAEIPIGVGVGDNASAVPVSPVSLSRSNSTGMNMAEALIQASSRTAPQLSSDAPRAEELTLRQCMQLIPMTPSMSKTSGLNSSEKPKFRGATKNGHYGPPKSSQQLSPHLLAVNNALRASAARSDAPKASQIGNFQVLCREKTGIISPVAANDAGAQVILKSSINPNLKTESKGTNKSLLSSSKAGLDSFNEKKLQPLAQNRSDFFNSLRKKTSIDHSIAAVVPEPSCCDSMEKSLSLEQNSGTSGDIAVINPEEERGNGYCTDASVINQEGDCADGTSTNASVANQEENADDSGVSCGDGADASSVEKLLYRSTEYVVEFDQSCCSDCNCHLVVDLDEREKAFLRSLGWEEDAPEEALTEEEIATFVKQHASSIRRMRRYLVSTEFCQRTLLFLFPKGYNLRSSISPVGKRWEGGGFERLWC